MTTVTPSGTSTAARRVTLTRAMWRAVAFSLLMALGQAGRAQADEPKDPPTRAGRVAAVLGDAWLFDADTREWQRLVRNQTVGEGDRLRTDERARVSVRVGSTSLWIDERSDVELTQLDEDRTLISIERGDVALRLRSTEAVQETRLRTREGSIAAETTGLYRVEQLDRGTKAYAFQGRLRFDWQRASEAAPLWLAEGEQVEFWWPGGPRAERSRLYGDAFSDWVLAESRAEGDWQVARYVSPEMTGAEDLDRHGRWETAPEWGTVWIPSVVVPNWAPYRFGHWAWTRHWGWTWVDDAPWGFAPFHYGRWVIWGGRWCWVPGSYVHRPVYAPALVGWVGTGGVSVSITLGSRAAPPRVGWYPLAPREVYVPAYRHTPRYEYRVNDRPDWRAARDPIPPGRPHLYREQPAAVTVVPRPGQAHGFEPLPRGHDDGWRGAKSLPGAPSRGDFNAMLPPRPVAPRVPDSTPRDGGPQPGWRSEGQPPRRDHGPQDGGPNRRLPMPLPQGAQTGAPQGLPQAMPQPAQPPLQHTVQQPAQPAIGTPPPVMPTQMAPLPNQSPARPMGGEEAFRRQQWEQQQREQQQRAAEAQRQRMERQQVEQAEQARQRDMARQQFEEQQRQQQQRQREEQLRREAWGQGQTQQPGFGGFQRPQVPTTQMPTTQMPPVQMPPQNTQRGFEPPRPMPQPQVQPERRNDEGATRRNGGMRGDKDRERLQER